MSMLEMMVMVMMTGTMMITSMLIMIVMKTEMVMINQSITRMMMFMSMVMMMKKVTLTLGVFTCRAGSPGTAHTCLPL